jgi:hypothetical protein
MSEATASEMPRYRSHKTVWALKIAGTSEQDKHGTLYLEIADPGYAPVKVEAAVVSRYFPKPGDYLVVYEDGYRSISPAKAFEDGYTRIT